MSGETRRGEAGNVSDHKGPETRTSRFATDALGREWRSLSFGYGQHDRRSYSSPPEFIPSPGPAHQGVGERVLGNGQCRIDPIPFAETNGATRRIGEVGVHDGRHIVINDP